MLARLSQRLRAELRSVRVRILAVVLGFMAIGLAAAGTVTFTVQLSQLNNRINAELRQEADELQQIALSGPEGDGRPYQNLDDLFFAYLQSGVPGEHESMMALIDGEAEYVIAGERPFELHRPEVLGLVAQEAIPGLTVTRDIWLDDQLIRLAMVSVQIDADPRSGVLVVGIDVSAQRGAIPTSARTYTLVGLATLLLSGLAGWVMAGHLMRPVRVLREATGRISAEDLTLRVPINGDADPDLVELAHSFNATLDRLEEGFVGQRRFLDDVAHELRTPLTIIQGNLELADPHDPDDVVQTRELLMDELDRMQRLVEDLLTLARAGRPDFLHLQQVSVPELATELMARLRPLGDRRWGCTALAAGQIAADRQRLIQVVVQLAANAVKFSADGDEITVSLAWAEPPAEMAARCSGAGRYLAIAVADTGVGIAPEDQERIFERFTRAQEAQRVDGSGLGLAIVSAIVDAHGGTVQLESGLDKGSTFTIWLPAAAEESLILDDLGFPEGRDSRPGTVGRDLPNEAATELSDARTGVERTSAD